MKKSAFSITDVRLHHITFSVSDLDKAQAFYEKLGFKYSRAFERPDYPAKFRDLVIKNMCLRLVEYQGKKNKLPACYDSPLKNLKTLGLKHFALRVKNLPAVKQRLDSYGYTFLDEKHIGKKAKIQKGVSGVDYIFLKDPDKNIVELVEEKK